MFDLSTLSLFLTTTVVIGLTPGPVIVYVVARSLQGSTSHGLLSALGAFVGGFAHIAAATLGLSALVMKSVVVFSILKYLGAAYLIYLGVRILLEREHEEAASIYQPLTNFMVFRQGAITDLLNPKTALFFLAFIPQFVNLDVGGIALQFFVYGMVANAVFTLLEVIIALLVGRLGVAFTSNVRQRKGRSVASGLTLVALGGFVAFTGDRNK